VELSNIGIVSEELSNIRYSFRGAQQSQRSSVISGIVSAELSNIRYNFRGA
jgi:hypothetical protein